MVFKFNIDQIFCILPLLRTINSTETVVIVSIHHSQITIKYRQCAKSLDRK